MPKGFEFSFSTLNILNPFLSPLVLCLQHPCVVHCFLKKGTYYSYVITLFFNVTFSDTCKVPQKHRSKRSLPPGAQSLNSHTTSVINLRIFREVIFLLLISNI